MLTSEAVFRFLSSRSAKGDSPETIKWYSIILSYFETFSRELPTEPEQIEHFLKTCKGGDERKHGFYRTLRALYKFLHRRYRIDNPVDLVDPPRRIKKLPKALTLEDLVRLLSYPHNDNISAYLQFLADTGARISELHNLKPQDIIKTPWGYIAKLSGKTGERFAPILDETYNIIMTHIPIPYCLDYLGDLISKAFKNAGVKGSAHSLRHTFGTLWEGSEFALQSILGHANFEMLANYRRLRTETISKLHKVNSPLLMIKNGKIPT